MASKGNEKATLPENLRPYFWKRPFPGFKTRPPSVGRVALVAHFRAERLSFFAARAPAGRLHLQALLRLRAPHDTVNFRRTEVTACANISDSITSGQKARLVIFLLVTCSFPLSAEVAAAKT